MLRSLLIFTLVLGLAPSVGEIVEMFVHRAVEGHWAHSLQHHDDRPGDGEHGCSPTGHLCHCCPNQAAERDEPVVVTIAALRLPLRPGDLHEAPLDVWIEPPHRPPIA